MWVGRDSGTVESFPVGEGLWKGKWDMFLLIPVELAL